MEKLYTIASISRELSIPESTLRYRAKMFKEYLPLRGAGRKKRFLEEAIERFSFIDELFNRGLVAEDIRVELSDKYDSEVEALVDENKGKRTKTVQQESEKTVAIADMMVELKEFLVPMIKVIENQEVIISELRKQNKLLALAPASKKGFWNRIFS